MLTLRNDQLSVAVLDPRADRELLGPRFCAGGYVLQVYDANEIPLLTRPQGSSQPFDPYHGEGLPEAFSLSPGADRAQLGEPVLVLGVGQVRPAPEPAPAESTEGTGGVRPEPLEYSDWSVSRNGAGIEMRTEHRFLEWRIELVRLLQLEGRTLSSTTGVRNHSNVPLIFQWFARPLFPLPPDGRICRFACDSIYLGEHPHFVREGDTGVTTQAPPASTDGVYTRVGLPEDCRQLRAHIPHPVTGEVLLTSDFRPYHLPVWANSEACSVQPYYQHVVIAGLEERWSLAYTFGGPGAGD